MYVSGGPFKTWQPNSTTSTVSRFSPRPPLLNSSHSLSVLYSSIHLFIDSINYYISVVLFFFVRKKISILSPKTARTEERGKKEPKKTTHEKKEEEEEEEMRRKGRKKKGNQQQELQAYIYITHSHTRPPLFPSSPLPSKQEQQII
jgi:hypothetical protein